MKFNIPELEHTKASHDEDIVKPVFDFTAYRDNIIVRF